MRYDNSSDDGDNFDGGDHDGDGAGDDGGDGNVMVAVVVKVMIVVMVIMMMVDRWYVQKSLLGPDPTLTSF